MARKRKKRRRKTANDDLITVKVAEIKSSCTYGCVISQDGRRIKITLANDKGDSFVITYYDNDCHDSRDNSRISHNHALSELKRLLGNDSGITNHREALFRSAVIA